MGSVDLIAACLDSTPGRISSPLRPDSRSMFACPNLFQKIQHEVSAAVVWNSCGFLNLFFCTYLCEFALSR
jgi:hypothetical protein